MPPDEFRETVLPTIANAWDDHCLCANPAFQKLLSFNFRNYGIGPVGLADSEILIDGIVRQRFNKRLTTKSHQGETTQVYECPQCKATCTESYEEFSVSMYQSTVVYDHDSNLAPHGLYLVGFYGFKQSDFGKIHDFQLSPSTEEFIAELRPE